MSLTLRRSTPLALTLMLSAALPAAGQSSPESVVTASGTARVERPADRLRMRVDLQTRDAELSQAVAKLRQRKDDVRKALLDLGAVAESIEFGEAVVGSAAGSAQSQMQRMVMMQMQNRQVDEAALAALPVTVTVSVTADWPLEGDASEDLLLRAHEIQKRVKEAKLAESREELTPEEQEIMEEMQGYAGYGMPQSKPGEPAFSYVATLPPRSRTDAMRQAIERARADALQLAEAAGLALGPVTRLSAGEPAAATDPQTAMMYAYMGMSGAAPQNPSKDPDEIAGDKPRVVHTVTVNATFVLQPAP